MSGAVLVSVAGRSTFSRAVARPAEGDEAQASGSMQNPHPCRESCSTDEFIAQIRQGQGWGLADTCWPGLPVRAGSRISLGRSACSLVAFPRNAGVFTTRGTHSHRSVQTWEFDGKLRCLQASVSFKSLKLH